MPTTGSSRSRYSATRLPISGSLRCSSHPCALHSRDPLPKAKFVIAATNARKQVLAADEIGPSAVTLGVDEYPEEYFSRLLRNGRLLVVDDITEVEKRDVDSLALYYSRKGKRLPEQGKEDGVKDFVDVLLDPALRETPQNGHLAHMVPIGLGNTDIAIAVRPYEIFPKQFKPAIFDDLSPSTMSNRDIALI